MKTLTYLIAVVAWVAGISLARGFWPTTAAYLLPPYAWALVADRLIGDEPEVPRKGS